LYEEGINPMANRLKERKERKEYNNEERREGRKRRKEKKSNQIIKIKSNRMVAEIIYY